MTEESKDLAIILKTDIKINASGYAVFYIGDKNNSTSVDMKDLTQKDISNLLVMLGRVHEEIKNKYLNLCELCFNHHTDIFPQCMPDVPEICFGISIGIRNVIHCNNFKKVEE